MKNKKHIYSIISLLIPVVVATINELTEQLENKRRDEEMTSLLQILGLSCREQYYKEILQTIIPKIDISFSITKYENYVAEKVYSR